MVTGVGLGVCKFGTAQRGACNEGGSGTLVCGAGTNPGTSMLATA